MARAQVGHLKGAHKKQRDKAVPRKEPLEYISKNQCTLHQYISYVY